MTRFSLYLTPGYVSVTVANGASRETSAPTVAQMLDHLNADDEAVVHRVCTAILAHLNAREGAAVLVNTLVSAS